jgi:uncharacterized phage-associated protein
MPYSAKTIANKFLELAKQDSEELTQMKMQKLIYISHGFNLAVTGEELIDEKIEAWRYGPVIESIYSEYRGFNSNPITDDATIAKLDNNFDIYYELPPRINNESTNQLIEAVWNKYKIYSAYQLSSMTHEDGTPWHTAMTHGNSIINNEIIKSYYSQLLSG